ncbi:unnamed protein product [Hyaloperonospora brassicae]|uniref:Casein kinase substrate phosphoprotein PP28 domain-containing protein n=1 Tax=Hyaloperonospora brassicae TaxID=162125 RepID=A0AAV0T2N3_HYABA|nr:unnamed protein product [Hyaloperonospora brassicae]
MQSAPRPQVVARASTQLNEALAVSATPGIATVASDDEEENKMVEALENLILEAYNKMQIDGECIFLPEEVAEKLHQAAEQVYVQDNGEQQQRKEKASGGKGSGTSGTVESEDALEEAEVMLQQQLTSDRLETEQEKEQEKHDTKHVEAIERESVQNQLESEGMRIRGMQVMQTGAVELREGEPKQRVSRVLSTENVRTELPSVAEVDESDSSDAPSASSSMRLRSRHVVDVLKLGTHAPAPGPGHVLSSSAISSSSTSSSLTASTNHNGRSLASRPADSPGGSKRTSKGVTYESRKEAALKLKEDKKKRELLAREAARNQREVAKRQLEALQQQKLEEKRERARRIREERLHRRAGKSTRTTGPKGSG